MSNYQLTVENISKSFSGKRIINDFSHIFSHGIYAITGTNGAGKSTLLKILGGMLSPEQGLILINHERLKKHYKTIIGYVPDDAPIYEFITGIAFLEMLCAVRKLKRVVILEWVERFGLEPHLNTKFFEMSQGTCKKFFIVAAIMHDPKILLLDEPTNALDQAAKNFLQQYIVSNSQGKIIIFASHDQELLAIAENKITMPPQS